MTLRLVCLDGHAEIALDRAVVVVGRHRWCDVRIASPRVSRRPCCLTLDRDGVPVRDLGSTHGTRINGRRVDQGVLGPFEPSARNPNNPRKKQNRSTRAMHSRCRGHRLLRPSRLSAGTVGRTPSVTILVHRDKACQIEFTIT
jgi:pSer/pThr/pTyr-binding forkhead associated (FHA) protein